MTEVTYRFDTKMLTGRLDRGKEQIIPGHDSRYWLEFHLAFYHYADLRAAGKRVLDIGCGYGYGAHLLARNAASVHGIDYHPPAIDYARETYRSDNLTFRIHDANEPLPFEDGTFDLVVSSEVLEHLRNQEQLVREMDRVLAPGGVAILKTPNRVEDPDNINPHHEHVFSHAEFTELMTSVFPQSEIFFWVQRIQVRETLVEFPFSTQIEKFGDPNPFDYAILLYAQTVPELVSPEEGVPQKGDLLAVCHKPE